MVLSRNGGEVLRTEPGACPGVAPVLMREKMLYAGKDAVMALDTNQLDKAAVNWAGISWLGLPVTPMVFARSCLQAYEERTGRPFPREPWEVLRECIGAVFNSWQSERATAYRRRHGIRSGCSS